MSNTNNARTLFSIVRDAVDREMTGTAPLQHWGIERTFAEFNLDPFFGVSSYTHDGEAVVEIMSATETDILRYPMSPRFENIGDLWERRWLTIKSVMASDLPEHFEPTVDFAMEIIASGEKPSPVVIETEANKLLAEFQARYEHPVKWFGAGILFRDNLLVQAKSFEARGGVYPLLVDSIFPLPESHKYQLPPVDVLAGGVRKLEITIRVI